MVGPTKSIAWFYGPHNIRCNAICPGAIAASDGLELYTTRWRALSATRSTFRPYRPLAKRDIADVAVFLASDEAPRVNGAVIPVDGGLVAY